MSRIRVVLADDHYLRREGLRRLLAECAEIELVAVLAEPRELLHAVVERKPDAVLTSHGVLTLLRGHPNVGVVLLHRYDVPAFALLGDGTSRFACLLEDQVSDIGQVLCALRSVVAGTWVVSSRILEAMVHAASPITTLTARELDVVRHMAQGRTNRAIAEALTLAESTVEKHVNTAFAKLGLAGDPRQHRRVAAVLTYLRHQDRNVREIPSLCE